MNESKVMQSGYLSEYILMLEGCTATVKQLQKDIEELTDKGETEKADLLSYAAKLLICNIKNGGKNGVS